MRSNIVLSFFLIIISSGCDIRKEYRYDERSIPIVEEKSSASRMYGPDYYLYAKNDESAKQIARNRFNSHFQKALESLDASITGKEENAIIMSIPISYSLIRKDGRSIDGGNSLSVSYSFDTIKTGMKYNESESDNVFAGLRFGMSVSEARTVELFKGFQWNAKEEALIGTCKIGLVNYSVDLLFYKGSLYRIKFSSFPRNNSYLKANDMHGEIYNLRNVLWRAYGMPSTIGTIPSDANIDSPIYDILDRSRYGKDIYTWDLPGKDVTIGYSRPNNNFRMVASITNEKLLQDIYTDRATTMEEERKTREDIIEQSSDLFN